MRGKVAVVTGGSRGLGREMVSAFAAAGADVVVASRQFDNCKQFASEIEARHGVRALPVACNVSEWAQCDVLVDTVYAEFDHVDVLVNNAGLSPLYPSLPEVGEALFDKVIGVNLKGPFRLTALVGTRMAAGEGGSIINVGSVEAATPNANALPYGAGSRPPASAAATCTSTTDTARIPAPATVSDTKLSARWSRSARP
jgi:NAD(P)-dependent dehydrogenase (short-subunit alcohol dehydrogenase family)